jgi:hypothetical protein
MSGESINSTSQRSAQAALHLDELPAAARANRDRSLDVVGSAAERCAPTTPPSRAASGQSDVTSNPIGLAAEPDDVDCMA